MLSRSFIIYSLKTAISGLIFILLLIFYYSTKITLGVVLALLYKRPGFNKPAKFLILLKHCGYDNFTGCQRVNRFSFPCERRLISFQYSEMLSVSLRFHSLSPYMFCMVFIHAKHPRSARGNFIPILKIIRDELPTE